MTLLLGDMNLNIKTYPIRLRSRGQITIPQAIRDKLEVNEGDILTLLQVGDFVVVSANQPRVPQLADKIVVIMEEENVSLADLLLGLSEERQAILKERHA